MGESFSDGDKLFLWSQRKCHQHQVYESLLADRKIHVDHKVLGFYDLDYVGYVCTLYYGDRYFRLRVFDLDWNEIQHPLGGDSTNAFRSYPLSSPRFFQAFKVKFTLDGLNVYI